MSLLLLLSGTAYGLSLFSEERADKNVSPKTPNAQVLTKLDLVDQHGHRLSPSDTKDKVILLNFFFTTCGSACPLQTAVLRDVQKELDATVDVLFVSTSISPLTDTPVAMQQYIEKYNIKHPNWKFVRTGVDNTDKLINEFKVTMDNNMVDPDQPNHRNMGYLFGKSGQLMQQYQLGPSIKSRLIREITEVSQL